MSQEIRSSWGRDDSTRVDPATPAPDPGTTGTGTDTDTDTGTEWDAVDITPDSGPPTPRRRRPGVGTLLVAVAAVVAIGVVTDPGARDVAGGYLARVGAPAGTDDAAGSPTPPAAPSPRARQDGERSRDDDPTAAEDGEGAAARDGGPIAGRAAGGDDADAVRVTPDPRDRGAAPGRASIDPLAPAVADLGDDASVSASLAAGVRWEDSPGRVAVDLTLEVTGRPAPTRLRSASVVGLGGFLPEHSGVVPRLLDAGRVVVPARLVPDCTSWWAPPPRVVLTLERAPLTPDGGAGVAERSRTVVVALPDRTTSDVIAGACPAPRRGLALAVTSARAAGRGVVQARVVNHGSRPARLHLSPGWLQGRVRIAAEPGEGVLLGPGRSLDLRVNVTSITSPTGTAAAESHNGRTVASVDNCSAEVSSQLGKAASIQAADPDAPDLGLVTASDAALPGDDWGHALSVAGIRCSPSGPSRS